MATARATKRGARAPAGIVGVEEAIEEFRAGRPVIIVDDEDRENEGDVCIPARVLHAGHDQLHGHARARPDLRRDDRRAARRAEAAADDRREHRRRSAPRSRSASRRATGVTTGISAADRARTMQVLIDPQTPAGRPHAPGPHVPAARARGRRARARRPDRGLCRPRAARGALPGRRDLRDDVRGRHDGAHAGAEALRAQAQA